MTALELVAAVKSELAIIEAKRAGLLKRIAVVERRCDRLRFVIAYAQRVAAIDIPEARQ